MKIVILDGHTLNPGDLSWDALCRLGACEVYERSAPERVVERARGAAVVLTNKVPIDRGAIDALPDLRLIAVTHDMVIAASPWGKIKTALQVAAVIALIVDDPPHTATTVLVAAAVAATIWSGIDYFISARDVLRAPA